MKDIKKWLVMGSGFTQNINGVNQEFRMCMTADVEPTITGAPYLVLIEESDYDTLRTAYLKLEKQLEVCVEREWEEDEYVYCEKEIKAYDLELEKVEG
jgi:hypothetical protein